MNEADLITLLQGNPDFARVTETSLAALISSGEIQEVDGGVEIIREKEAGQRIWVLIEGELEVLVNGELVNRISSPGEVVGQISAVSLTAATATVRMAKAGKCLAISHRALHEVMKGSPQLAESILRSMAKYLERR